MNVLVDLKEDKIIPFEIYENMNKSGKMKKNC